MRTTIAATLLAASLACTESPTHTPTKPAAEAASASAASNAQADAAADTASSNNQVYDTAFADSLRIVARLDTLEYTREDGMAGLGYVVSLQLHPYDVTSEPNDTASFESIDEYRNLWTFHPARINSGKLEVLNHWYDARYHDPASEYIYCCRYFVQNVRGTYVDSSGVARQIRDRHQYRLWSIGEMWEGAWGKNMEQFFVACGPYLYGEATVVPEGRWPESDLDVHVQYVVNRATRPNNEPSPVLPRDRRGWLTLTCPQEQIDQWKRGAWGPGNTYTYYTFPGPADSLAWTFRSVTDPPASLRDKGLLHYYAYGFTLTNSTDALGYGYAGFQSNGIFAGTEQQGKVVNFAVWGSSEARTTGLTDPENDECGCHQIMYPFEYVEGRDYRFTVREGPSGSDDDWKWWGLWVTDLDTDSTTFIGEQRLPTTIEDNASTQMSPNTHVFGEDLHWWHSLDGTERYICSDFEVSSLVIKDVTANANAPINVESRTNSGEENVGWNGHETTLCDVTVYQAENGDVQHNLGFWHAVPPREIGN